MNFRTRTIALLVALTVLVPAVAFAGKAPKTTDKATTTQTTTTTTTTTPTGTTATPTTGTASTSQDAMMAEMMKYATPGPMQAALKNAEGTWNAAITSWSMGPQPVTATGTETRTMILGGRFLETRTTGTFMGQPYEGWGLTGFDNRNKKLMEMWADNTATSWWNLSGTMSDDGKTMSCSGTVDGPDGKPMDIRTETKFDSDTQMTYTMYGKMNGQDTKMMQIVYTKAAGTADAQSK